MENFEHPFRITIAGKSGRGKTTTLLNMITRDDIIQETYHQIYIICPTFWTDKNYRLIKKGENIFVFTEYNEEVIEKIIKESTKDNSKKKLIILDDIMGEEVKRGGVATYQNKISKLMANARHYNLTIIISVQNIGQVNEGVLSNTDVLVLYRTDNEDELKRAKKKFAGNLTLREFKKLTEFSWEGSKKNFLLINNHYNLDKPIYYKNMDKIIFEDKKMSLDESDSSDDDYYFSESD